MTYTGDVGADDDKVFWLDQGRIRFISQRDSTPSGVKSRRPSIVEGCVLRVHSWCAEADQKSSNGGPE